MPIELLTTADLASFKEEILKEVACLLEKKTIEPDRILKSKEVCKLLRISTGTLQHLRKTNKVAFNKVGGTYIYYYEDVRRMTTGIYGIV
jgi:hypothetical protein